MRRNSALFSSSTLRWRLGYLTFLVTVFVAVVPTMAYAYIDPATTSYIIQIVSGLIISLSVAIGVFFRRIQMSAVTARARLSALLVRLTHRQSRTHGAGLQKDDPQLQARKTHRQLSLEKMQREAASMAGAGATGATGAGAPGATGAGAPAARLSKRAFLLGETRRFRERLLPAALVAAGLSFTLVIFGSIDIFAVNRNYFPYGLSDVFVWILAYAGAFFLLLAIIMLLTRGRLFDFTVSTFCGLLIALYVQGNFFNTDIGELAGSPIPWHDYSAAALINTCICLVIIALPFILYWLNRKLGKGILIFVPLLIIAMQSVALIADFSSDDLIDQRQTSYLSREGLYEVADKDNIFVIIIDSFDQQYWDDLQAKEPSFFKGQFDGFVEFDNNTSVYSDTWPSAINMLTQARYVFDYPGEEFLAQAWANDTFLPTLHDEGGYAIKIYTDEHYAYNDATEMGGIVENVENATMVVNRAAASQHLLELSLFRYLPYVFKPFFWMPPDALAYDSYRDGSYGIFMTYDDPGFYRGLKTERLSVTPGKKDFVFYHLNGVHEPYDLSEDVVRQEELTDQETVAKAELNIVFEFMDQLKELGLYQDSTIIITADHGVPADGRDAGWTHEVLEPDHPILLVKPSGNADTPMTLNHAPVSSDNMHATVLAAAGVDHTAFGPTYFEVDENSAGERDFFFAVRHPREGSYYIQQFVITGDAKDFANWHEVRRIPIKYWY
jgi:hypothetical protein